MKKILIASAFVLCLAATGQAACPDFGPDGLKNLTKQQIDELEDDEIIFSTTDQDCAEGSASSLIEAVVIFDRPPQQVWDIISQTERQDEYLNEIKEINIIWRKPDQDVLEFKLKVAMLALIYRVNHHYEPHNRHIHWSLVTDFDNDIESLRGYWKFYPYDNGKKTLVRYGSSVTLKGVPEWVQAIFKKSGVKKSLESVKDYVEDYDFCDQKQK